jgi:shikimate kinase
MPRAAKSIDKIAFIGMMGAGKTFCARTLAKKLHWRDLDSDVIIERREKMSIPQIFRNKGESYFRTVESRVIKDLLVKPQTVLSLGGGVVCRKVNRSLLKKKSFVIWLKAKPEVIQKRTSKSANRPLLNVDDPKRRINEIIKERDSYYRQCAHVVVTNNGGNILSKLARIPQIRHMMRANIQN